MPSDERPRNVSQNFQFLGDALSTRRQAIGGATALSASALLAGCFGGGDDGGGGTTSTGSATTSQAVAIPRGGNLRIGQVNASAKDTLDAHTGTGLFELASRRVLYEPLAVRDLNYQLRMLVAESIEPQDSGDATSWIVKIRPGIEFHNGKSVTADDVIFSLKRILTKKLNAAAALANVDLKQLKKLDERTVSIKLKKPDAEFRDTIGDSMAGIVPEGFDPKNPVGTGPFAYKSFQPAQQLSLTKFANYWDHGKPYLDGVTMVAFDSSAAIVNALLSGQIDVGIDLPADGAQRIKGKGGLGVVESPTPSWLGFGMRADKEPFTDVRVRQAFRLIAGRPQMLAQALQTYGRIANDLYAPQDPGFAKDIPQREQDIEKAKSLLKQAGKAGLSVDFTLTDIGPGSTVSAQVFAEQAKAAGVKVNLVKTDYNSWLAGYGKHLFSQDLYFSTRNYLAQVGVTDLPGAPFNVAHWYPPEFTKLIDEARAELDEAKRNDVKHAAQQLQWDQGGWIIPWFKSTLDGHTSSVVNVRPSKVGYEVYLQLATIGKKGK